MAVSCSLLRDAMEIGAVEGQYLIHGPFGYATHRWAILSFGVGVFGTDEPVVGRDDEGPTLDWRALVFSFQSAPQGTPHTPDACGDMADFAGTFAKSALTEHPNDPKEALAQFDRDFSRLYVGHSAGGRLGAIKMGAPKPLGRQSRDRKIKSYFLGDSGFKSEFLDKDHDPNNHVRSDQTHHFAAYLTLGISGHEKAALAHTFEDYYRNDNPGDARLGMSAYMLGLELKQSNGQDLQGKLNGIGDRIRSLICTPVPRHRIFKGVP